jgi:hypothetical protein
MKKVVFKWVTTMVDYDTEANAKKDIARIKKAKGGNVFIKDEGWTSNSTFEEVNGSVKCYTVEYCTRYNDKINPGW